MWKRDAPSPATSMVSIFLASVTTVGMLFMCERAQANAVNIGAHVGEKQAIVSLQKLLAGMGRGEVYFRKLSYVA